MSKQINLNKNMFPSHSGGESGNMLSKISSKARSLITQNFIFLVAGIFFLIVGAYYVYYYLVPRLNPSFKPNNELVPINSNDTSKEAELLFFYADWCPHCKTAKPVWNELKDEYQNKTINGYSVVFTEINCTTENAEVEKMMNQYKVEGFPTIKLLKDGQVIEYDAKPTKETLNQFLTTVL
jgi:thiol-disulfide isomerase/thioredoxin